MQAYKKAVGATEEKIENARMAQAPGLPASALGPSLETQCQLITHYLWVKECQRAAAVKSQPLYPMEFDSEGRCLGLPLMLRRVRKEGKNFGRFYVMTAVTETDAEGDMVLNEEGQPKHNLKYFKFLDQHDYVRSGALKAVSPEMDSFLAAKYYGEKTKPGDMEYGTEASFMRWPAPEVLSNMEAALATKHHE